MQAAAQPSEGSVVAHVVVVGFHAQLGHRIEFAYPRLRGTPILRSPKISDTSDISADVSPTISRRLSTEFLKDLKPLDNSANWGTLPPEWALMPLMALPDGVHDHHEDLVFFTLPPEVHCVSCFRQVAAVDAKTHSASAGTAYEQGVAARGSVQKSVVLLCRRPLFGVLADRLEPAVRAYFDQADFARTDVLLSLYHSLNVSLSRPSLNRADTLFHGLDLRAIIRRLGPQTLAVLKLIMLERRVIVYSQPVHHASNAVIALASVFPGALDSISPTYPPLEIVDKYGVGFPLSLFAPKGRVVLQPHAPLPLISELIPNNVSNACLLGTSHNVGLLLSSTAASAARRAAAARKSASASAERPLEITQSHSAPVRMVTPDRNRSSTSLAHSRPSISPFTPVLSNNSNTAESSALADRASGGVPIVDALVNLSSGKVSVSGVLEPLCRITRQERRFMRDLMVSAASSSASVSASGSTGRFIGSDDYIRERLREYLTKFLRSVAAVSGVRGGPVVGETYSAEMVNDFDLSKFEPYNTQFAHAWMTTRNAGVWSRSCPVQPPGFVPPPKPEVDESLIDEPLIPVDKVAAGWSGLRQNVAEFGRFSSFVSSKAAEGISSLFKRLEQEVGRMDLGNQPSPHTPASTGRVNRQEVGKRESQLTKSAPR
ncbi:Late secretory pathway protein AVL9-like [Gracilariopsis chorda]|uniref:Late secretory pathway protein AVL9-like n=1 Tax=Gracilariopsis chorda TaxID=448386 RepID=A0A2V3IP70_9FLOR|nr:Late secretory pathway protein AVL9-like [Gracilariopsis chorda]|eukprot:PXF43864.1 Late secretory pathway protein AVL9-like [Gracilariopsis chorda]